MPLYIDLGEAWSEIDRVLSFLRTGAFTQPPVDFLMNLAFETVNLLRFMLEEASNFEADPIFLDYTGKKNKTLIWTNQRDDLGNQQSISFRPKEESFVPFPGLVEKIEQIEEFFSLLISDSQAKFSRLSSEVEIEYPNGIQEKRLLDYLHQLEDQNSLLRNSLKMRNKQLRKYRKIKRDLAKQRKKERKQSKGDSPVESHD